MARAWRVMREREREKEEQTPPDLQAARSLDRSILGSADQQISTPLSESRKFTRGHKYLDLVVETVPKVSATPHTLSRLCPSKSRTVGMGDRMYISRTGQGAHSQVNRRSRPLDDLLPHAF